MILPNQIAQRFAQIGVSASVFFWRKIENYDYDILLQVAVVMITHDFGVVFVHYSEIFEGNEEHLPRRH